MTGAATPVVNEAGERKMHAEVLTALDAHLAELRDLRHQLTGARLIGPGERLDVVLRIEASAESLARTVYGCRAATSASVPG